ncbi:MAG: hypothetical protein KGN01_06780 [Patescibacteria group bacterium]|nr:hypothetical protein [Patescibacteria group bacterium]
MNVTVQFILDDSERDELERRASKLGLSLSAFLRMKVKSKILEAEKA